MLKMNNKCDLCRKCIGICRKTVGREAIGYKVKENGDAEIIFSLDKCIACGSCAYICDRGAVFMNDSGEKRIITTPSGKMEFKLKQCDRCGDFWIPEKQLEFMVQKTNIPMESLDLCPDCRD
ncbi:MAG: 4Fe-4S binding protein [Dehalococcoidia bacterium]|nr:MAG: 4Fe-4S binding protein [Dehalococcoidia bacterium]